MKVKESALGASYSMNQNTESKTVLDLEANTLDYSSKVTMSTGDTKISQESAFKVKEENGEYTLVSGKLDGSITMEAVEFLFLELQTNVYSWNYSGAEGSLLSALAILGADADESEEAVKFYQSITSKLVKALTVNIDNIPVTFNKLVTSFEEGLMKSNVVGFKLSTNSNGAKASAELSMNTEFLYTFID